MKQPVSTFKNRFINSLFLFLTYEALWLPIDSYNMTEGIYHPTLSELFIDFLVCSILHGINKAIRFLLIKRYGDNFVLSIGNDLLPYLILFVNILCSIPITLAQIEAYQLMLSSIWDWQDMIINILLLSIIATLYSLNALVKIHNQVRKELANKREEEIKKTARTKILALQRQINPHFLFNNFSTLVGLISTSPTKAITFVNNMACIYRHILEKKENYYIHLEEEISILKRYIDLSHFCYGNALKLSIHLSDTQRQTYILPGTLIILAENVIKHNILSEDNPIRVVIKVEGNQLIFSNDYRPLAHTKNALGVGQQNIKQRYAAIDLSGVSFTMNNQQYIATIPIIPKPMLQ